MKNIFRVLLAVCAILVLVAPAQAVTLWYNGDFNGANGLANEQNTSVTQASVYDDFIVPIGQTWTVNAVFSDNLMDTTTPNADWSIRSGVSAGNGGTVIASGTNAATQTPTGRSGFGFTEYMVEVTGLNIVLGPGTYWLNVTPIDSGSGRSFNSTTSGANAVGTPPGNNGNSFFDSTFFGFNFAPISDVLGSSADFSMGIAGTTEITRVPEPSTLLLLGAGLVGLAAWRRVSRLPSSLRRYL